MKPLTEEERYDAKRIARQNILYAAILIAAVILINLWRGSSSAKVTPSREGITLSGHDSSVTVLYSDMTGLEYFSAPDYRTPVDGGTFRNWRYGTWESPDLGRYEAYASTRIKGCMLFLVGEERYVFNFENDSATKELYESIWEEWQKRQ